MCKVSKPYKNRNKWRVRVTDKEIGWTRSFIYDTEAEALAARPKLLRGYGRPIGVPMQEGPRGVLRSENHTRGWRNW